MSSEAAPYSLVFEDVEDMSNETTSIVSESVEDVISTDSEMDISLPEQTPEEINAEAYAFHAKCNLDIDPSLTLPLWCPSPVQLGSVGYYTSTGSFTTLFNVASTTVVLPNGSSLPPVWTSSNPFALQITEHGCKGNAYAVPLTPGQKEAYLIAKSAVHTYVRDLDTPKAWLEAHIDTIVEAYGEQHHLRREDISMVIGSLNAIEYTHFVSHSHPPSNLFFSVAWYRIPGEVWGRYTLKPSSCDEDLAFCFAEKTTKVTCRDEVETEPACGDAVVLARLGFRDGDEGAVLV